MQVTAAAFGIAGPIVEHRSKLTNLGWDVDGQEVADCLKVKHVGLLNDLEAMAYGTLRLRDNERVVLQKGKRQERRTIAVIAAGTGLGEAGLLWDGRRYLAIPTEGGHSDFGPRNELEIELMRFLLGRHKRVSYERVVCGPGLKNTYDFFRHWSGVQEPAWLTAEFAGGDPAAVIARAGSAGKDAVCKDTLDLALHARETLMTLGIVIEPFGGDTVLVTSYPAMLATLSPAEILRQVVEQLLSGPRTPERRDLLDELLHMISCKAAIKAGDRLAPEEITALLQQRHLFQDTHHCPHGRPTALVFTKDELDKRFKRI